ncbi:MAG: molybdenum cofactor biosynthesis protein MoaE [Gammaproteobacteria bacterium]|nr:molybdenum cofactor biosynthesis protein MoaE [Gammaproteobacteria bacterium]
MVKRSPEITIVLKEGPIYPQAVLNAIGAKEHGGEVCFFGVVRNHNEGQTVTQISYDIFIPLAENTLHAICCEAQNTWGHDLKICIHHAYGDLKVGNISVGIGVSSVHREESFKACRFIIEEIKHRVPIWKKEIYSNGTGNWVKGHVFCK